MQNLTCYNIWKILTDRFALSSWCWAYIIQNNDKDERLEYYVKNYKEGIYFSVSEGAYASMYVSPFTLRCVDPWK